jgi:hypothetical protein
MAAAKQQYQAAMAAAAIQAADEAWERASSVGNSSNPFSYPSADGNLPASYSYTGPFNALTAGPASAFGGSLHGPRPSTDLRPSNPHPATSVYGESFGPSSQPKSSIPKVNSRLHLAAGREREPVPYVANHQPASKAQPGSSALPPSSWRTPIPSRKPNEQNHDASKANSNGSPE